MHTLLWKHTRTGKQMMNRGTVGFLMVRVMMIRQAFPGYPMTLDGVPV